LTTPLKLGFLVLMLFTSCSYLAFPVPRMTTCAFLILGRACRHQKQHQRQQGDMSDRLASAEAFLIMGRAWGHENSNSKSGTRHTA
jgi:hypothetical protein